MSELKPCPLCGSETIGSDHCGDVNRVFCYSCGLTLDNAWKLDGTTPWNTRTPDRESVEEFIRKVNLVYEGSGDVSYILDEVFCEMFGESEEKG